MAQTALTGWRADWENKIFEGFQFTRPFGNGLPPLPPGYDWETQLKKYSPYVHPSGHAHRGLHTGGRKREQAVFCHRGLYDRALGVPENSIGAVENGLARGLRYHEVDVRGTRGGRPEWFLAHDAVLDRTTAAKGRFSAREITDIVGKVLVSRRLNVDTYSHASSYKNTTETLPGLYEFLNSERIRKAGKSLTIQFDLRGNDFPRLIEEFSRRELDLFAPEIILKGYNLEFPHVIVLQQAIAKIRRSSGRPPFLWNDLIKRDRAIRIIMVFYSEPIVDYALQHYKTIDPRRATCSDRFGLSYPEILRAAKEHIASFANLMTLGGAPDSFLYEKYFDGGAGHRGHAHARGVWSTTAKPSARGYRRNVSKFIPEIAHSGLGLLYDPTSNLAFNPLDRSPITDPGLVFNSRVDRAMIQVGEDLRALHEDMVHSTCVRLCDTRIEGVGEFTADMWTGRLRRRPAGDEGLATKLRTIHGGLYPQADLVVADDPFAEIAARTWIDEYKQLKREELLSVPYNEWLRRGGRDLVEAMREINGPFLANTYRFSEPARQGMRIPASLAPVDTGSNLVPHRETKHRNGGTRIITDHSRKGAASGQPSRRRSPSHRHRRHKLGDSGGKRQRNEPKKRRRREEDRADRRCVVM